MNIFSRKILVTILLGFSSGLPFAATLGTLQGWMKDAGVDLALIGFYGMVRLPYTLKFLWAPFIDRYSLPFLGRRRGWILLTQLLLIGALTVLGTLNPKEAPWLVAFMALVVCFVSASQDIVLDAHRRDSLEDKELGLGTSLFIAGYRLGMLFSGGFAFWLAARMAWSDVYFILGLSIGIGILGTLIAPEPPEIEGGAPKSLREAIIGPIADYFSKPRAWEILLFILLYKLGDNIALAVSTYYILDLGFTKDQYFAIVKTFGLVAMIVGGLVGGTVILKIGISRSLWLFGALQCLTLLGFTLLSLFPQNELALGAVIVGETLSIGLGTSAYTAFMASLCNRKFSATQYALLTSLMGVPGVLLTTPSGIIAKYLGWELYFIFAAAMAIPGMLMLLRVAPWPRSS